MGLSSMQGTPWHIEIIRKSVDDERRSKKKCKYYLNGKCSYYNFKCPGSAHCDSYSIRKKTKKYKKGSKSSFKSNMFNQKKEIVCGTFEVLFLEDNEVLSCEIDETISREAPLVKYVFENEVDSIFELNGNKIKVLKKNFYLKKGR